MGKEEVWAKMVHTIISAAYMNGSGGGERRDGMGEVSNHDLLLLCED